MKNFSYTSKLQKTSTSIFSVMSKLSKEYDSINLGQGFPNYDPPQKLIELSQKYLFESKNQYAPMPGVLQLRKNISNKIRKLYNTDLDPDSEITITAGATQAIFTIIQAFIKKGDEVIIIEPAYDSYAPAVELAGGKIKSYKLDSPDFKVDWTALSLLINNQTKMIIVNSPHNPIGKVLQKEDIVQLEKIVLENGLLLLSDEVYEHLVYDNKSHESILKYPNLYQNTICVFSFGKTFHNTGWKLGYCVASQNLMQEIRNIHQWNVFSVNSFLQYAIAEFLEDESSYSQLSSFYQEKRDFFNSKMSGSALLGLECEGTYFQLFDYSSISNKNDVDFAKWLTIEHGVTTIPISPFYQNLHQSKVVRVCFAKDLKTLDEAASKLIQIV